MNVVFTRLRAWCCLAVAGLLLAACATSSGYLAQPDGSAFQRSGRFAVSVSYFDGKRDAVQGGFVWRDTGDELVLDLANPLGSTLARVQVRPGYAVLTRSNGQTEQAAHPDALVEQALGSPIPVANLRDWFRGRTGSAPVSDLETNEAGQIASFTQNGWRVQLSRYDDAGPRLLQMNRNDANRSISARLVANER